MDFAIKEITGQEEWEGFLAKENDKTFLQSWNWGEFQKLQGNKIWRLGAYGNELIGVSLVVKVVSKRGTFLFLPHGPVVKGGDSGAVHEVVRRLVNKLKEIAKGEDASFIRVSPCCLNNEKNKKLFADLGFRDAPIHMHAEVTWELDISAPEEKILAGMRKTTRYLIKQAQKNDDIKIISGNDADDINLFNEVYKETVSRHIFVPFSLDYLRKEFSAFSKDDQVAVFLGKYKQEVVSSAIIIFWQNMAFYHHGASLSKYNKFPVSYAVQWEAIKEAKRRGCQFYNFWGIAPDIANEQQTHASRHPWAGLTLFKMGFGGYRKEYVKTQDLPLLSSYWLTYIFEKLRKIRREL